MSIYVYIYRYSDDKLQGKGVNVHEYLSLSASPGIYYKCYCNGEWSVVEITDYGSFNTLLGSEVPNEVKIHHLLTQ